MMIAFLANLKCPTLNINCYLLPIIHATLCDDRRSPIHGIKMEPNVKYFS